MKKNKMKKWIIKEILRQKDMFDETCSHFYSGGTIVEFQFPAVGDDEALEYLYRKSMIYPNNSKEQREKDKNRIIQIHQNVWEGKVGNIEVHFDERTIQFENSKYELANMIAMIRVESDFAYFFFNEGDKYDAQLFIEATSESAFLVLGYHEKDSNEDVAIIILDEFYLLGWGRNEKTEKETGIVVGYDWADRNTYCDFVEDIIFSPVKELFAADWLQEKWKKTKEANEKKIESMP